MFDGCIINISWIEVNKRDISKGASIGLAVIKTVTVVARWYSI